MNKFEAKLAGALNGLIKENYQKGFESALNRNPRDWASRLIYADWLEDQDMTGMAQLQRFLASNQIAPSYFSGYWGWRIYYNWENNGFDNGASDTVPSDLAEAIVKRYGLDQPELFYQRNPYVDMGPGVATYSFGDRVWNLRFRGRQEAESILMDLVQ